MERLERFFELCVLRGRAAGTLSGPERARESALGAALPAGVPSLDAARVESVIAPPWPARLSVDGRPHGARVGNLGAEGVAISTDARPALGQWVSLAIYDARHGLEYHFPCRVVARVRAGGPWLGLRVDGLPRQGRVAGQSSGTWTGPPAEGNADPSPAGRRRTAR